MDWTKPLDLYCERVDPGFWAEPVNALSNGAFLIAALVLLARARRAAFPVEVRALATLIALVGVGSFAFHTFATVWAALLDVGFILLFIYAFLGLFAWRVMGLGPVGVGLSLAVYFAAGRLLTGLFPRGALNGSYDYFPPLIALVLLGVYALRRRPGAARPLFAAAALFAVSLTLRTIDLGSCESWPLGTHFMWHCLNAGVLYLATTAFLVAARTD
jgi:hypothetical protein